MKHLRHACSCIVYLDETCVNQNYTVFKCWNDTQAKQATGVKALTGKGSRLIILHAGTKHGFIPNAELIFQAKNDGDYHNQMTATVFENWLRNQLLPNIPPNSVIVMENHSVQVEKRPNSSWLKADVKAWLIKQGAQPREELLKGQLLELAKKYGSDRKKYVVDEIAADAGHRVVRFPPYHCQYNPIELIWAQVKTYIAQKNYFKMANLKPLVKEALSRVTPENWENAVKHAKNLQEEYAKLDIAVDKVVDSFVINISEETSDEEDLD